MKTDRCIDVSNRERRSGGWSKAKLWRKVDSPSLRRLDRRHVSHQVYHVLYNHATCGLQSFSWFSPCACTTIYCELIRHSGGLGPDRFQ